MVTDILTTSPTATTTTTQLFIDNNLADDARDTINNFSIEKLSTDNKIIAGAAVVATFLLLFTIGTLIYYCLRSRARRIALRRGEILEISNPISPISPGMRRRK
ncbi:21031_t:CDS:1 [Entrophospora sp. SA101]|nr:9877_t:CDS:1 [Entrophospora sp. SA101]CAJ0746998.1 21031_t:CDS:1 [Entrophospora sp. SA101]CAJ0841937.1 10685_t:CDS:1 [Entrophospora sp. SA101]CAJ0908564.1 13454_t:CDS:1 [Entrophospora sp. SA101]